MIGKRWPWEDNDLPPKPPAPEARWLQTPKVRLKRINKTHIQMIELLRILVRRRVWVSLHSADIMNELVRRGVVARDGTMFYFLNGWYISSNGIILVKKLAQNLSDLGLCEYVPSTSSMAIATVDGQHTLVDWDDPTRDCVPCDR